MLKINRRHDYRGAYENLRGLLDMIIDLPQAVFAHPMLEIGSFTGDSTQIFRLAFKNITSIDPHLPDKLHYATHEEVMHIFQDNIAGRNIDVVTCTSDEAFAKAEIRKRMPGYFGFAYIDGNHNYEFIKRDILNVWPMILTDGYIAGHDYGLSMPGQDGMKPCVDEIFGEPDSVYIDGSWIVQKTKNRTFNPK